ncbi:hypothetical protein DY000_02053701 [Brassica cretica]|uniref:Retrotransposon gag domain-containing protein n=1 Tax=Brassica cretica TaxID=69181 RepID=A0ABQ7AAG9_BRACR|nr:hypothetical protein DY000_02053701 [Brassica cretica]
MFSDRLDAMQSMVERLPGVAPPIRKSNPDSYANNPFTVEITLIEMPKKLSFPTIQAYDGTTDPDDHVAQYRQSMLAVALPKGSREATMCKGFGSTLTGPALQWYINLPSRSIASFAVLSDKFVEQFASSRDLEKAEGMVPESADREGRRDGSVSRPELINVLRQMGQQVKWPQKMKAPDSFRNPGFWCDFHRDHGHKMEDCVTLKIYVTQLLRKGHLGEFLSEKVKSHLSMETTGKPTEAAPVSPPR